MTTAPVEMKPPKRRRGFRVSLRVFMLIVVAAGAWLGWLANGARTQRLAVAAIRRINNGGTVVYAEEMGSTPASTYQFRNIPTLVPGRPSWAWTWLRQELGRDYFDTVVVAKINSPDAAKMAAIGELPALRVLELFNTKELRDVDWSALRGLDRLERLILYDPSSNAAVIYLSGMPRLRTLSLGHFPLDEAAFRRVGRLRQVERLFMAGNEFQDAWLAHLAGMDGLRDLYLPSTTIGDEGLIYLRKLSWLKTVDLRGTRVTQDGVDALKRTMPGLRVRFP